MSRRPLPPDLAPTRIVNLANDLNSSAIHLLRRLSQDDAADGVTAARASALSVLVYGGATTLGELARRERVATPTMSRLIAAMVDEGLVTRTPVAGNRRAVTLLPTPRGRELMERGRARRISRLSAELAALTADEIAALERAIEVLARLAQSLPPAARTKRPTARSTHP
jgi:DNA-binding MarR family transcriptional regulator